MERRETAPLVTAMAAAVLTTVLVFTPLRFAYRRAELRVLLETTQAVIAALVALLLYGRHRRSALWGDLLAAYALFLFGITNLFFALLPALTEPTTGGTLDRFNTWAPLVARTVGAVALATAALAPGRWSRLRRPGLAVAGALAATVGSIAAVMLAVVHRLPPVIEAGLATGAGERPDLDAPRTLLAAQLVLLGTFALAAAGFGRQARRDANPLVTALACGCVLAAFARLNFFLYPSIYTDVVHVGDVLRLLFFLVLLVGAGAEIAGYWRVEADAAAVRERQRLARELHDGLAQELSFIRSHTASMARGTSHPGVTPLVAEAAERAMAESRRVVEALRSDGTTSLEQLLGDAARDVLRPAGIPVDVAVDAQVWLPAVAHPEVGELVRRATTNAVRLRQAARVSVRLGVRDGRAVLSVEDDGAGRQAPGDDATANRALGRRAESLGGTCRAVGLPGGGTRVEILLPWRPGRRREGREARARLGSGAIPVKKVTDRPGSRSVAAHCADPHPRLVRQARRQQSAGGGGRRPGRGLETRPVRLRTTQAAVAAVSWRRRPTAAASTGSLM